MFLKTLRLKNIRCFHDAFLDFDLVGGDNRKWTVLLGENGTGTSTVLKSVALVMSGSDALGELIGNPDSWITAGAGAGEISVEIETASGRSRAIGLELVRGASLEETIARSRETLKLLNDALEHTNRSYQTIGYGSMRRLPDAGSESQEDGRFTHQRSASMASLFFHGAELQPLEKWAMSLVDEVEGASQEISNVLADFLPEMTFSHIDVEHKALMFKTSDGVLPLRQLSLGHQTIAAWVGDLLLRIISIFGEYKDPLSARGLLLIDEIDAHLHPKWQRRLLNFLNTRLPRMQLLVTTNSVVTAQQSPPDALHYCMRRDGPSVIEKFDLDPRNLLLHQLIATEAFGRMSDESLAVEQSKDEFRTLQKKERKSGADQSRMAAISEQLALRPHDEQGDMVLTETQRALMAQLLKQETGSER